MDVQGLHGPAKEMLKVCIQLRTEQHRHGFVEHALLNKTKKCVSTPLSLSMCCPRALRCHGVGDAVTGRGQFHAGC